VQEIQLNRTNSESVSKYEYAISYIINMYIVSSKSKFNTSRGSLLYVQKKCTIKIIQLREIIGISIIIFFI